MTDYTPEGPPERVIYEYEDEEGKINVVVPPGVDPDDPTVPRVRARSFGASGIVAPPPKPLFYEEEQIVVPVREGAQRAFAAWLAHEDRIESLNEALADFGLDLHHNVAVPILKRIVFELEPRYLLTLLPQPTPEELAEMQGVIDAEG